MVLVVGQTPPPFGGQAVMIERLLSGTYAHVRLVHVRLAFSNEVGEIGRFGWRKVRVLFTTILAIYKARIRHRPRVFYYPPSGPDLVPVLRDIVLLLAVRWLFPRTVFHFHAGGVSTFGPRLPAILRPLYRAAYSRPDLAIRLSPSAPEDPKAFHAREEVIVPNGIDDLTGGFLERPVRANRRVRILFTAVLIPSKGVEVAIHAVQRLLAKGLDVELTLMGGWGDAAFQQHCEDHIRKHGMQERVRHLGVRTGPDKDADFRQADIFCFPTHFASEVFPLVIAEASMYGLPIVATRWRGLPDMVDDQVNGFLVGTEDPEAVAERLERLVLSADLRRRMGREGRRIFEERFSITHHRALMEDALCRAAT